MKNLKNYKLPSFPIPGWLFTIFQICFCEILLHVWVMDSFSFPRFVALILFALGFGGLVSQIVSFFGKQKWSKTVTIILCFLITAFYMVEFFVNFAYQVFMPISTLLGGAKGVATDFFEEVVVLVVQEFWRIVVVVIPLVLYGIFARPCVTSWRTRWMTLASSLVCYVVAFALVMGGTDSARLGANYNFDSAVHVLGLNMGVSLDAIKGGETATTEEFIMAPPAATQPPAPTQSADPDEVPDATEPIVYGPNVIEALDFAALAESEMNGRVAKIHNYVNSLVPSSKNEYTGLFAGKNLILITAEGFSKEVIDPELTPTLYRLANEGIQFNNYYQPYWTGSTSSGEFSVLMSLVPTSSTNSIKESIWQDLFMTMGNQLQRQGYNSWAYHNHLYTYYDRHLTHKHYGYDTYMGMGNGLEKGVKEQWPESDLEMMEFTVEQYIDQQPFSVYYMTISGHLRYNFPGNKMSRKNEEKVAHLDASETIRAYIACNLELEYALQHLVQRLEEEGIADDTVIVLSADHYPYGLEWDSSGDYMTELYGYKYKNIIERDHNALIIWSGAIEDMDIVVNEPVYSLDILPTLSNLFGLEFDSRIMVGRDALSDAEPIVLWYDNSWVTDKGSYDFSSNTFTPVEGAVVEEGYVERISAMVSNKIFYSREVHALDYFNYLSKVLFPKEK